MKTQLIMLDTPVIVSDEEIKKGDYFLADEKYIIFCKGKVSETFINDNFYRSKSQKIIAGVKGLPTIDWNGLENEFGWVDVETLAKNNGFDWYNTESSARRVFEKWHKSLNEKKFSLEDMKKALNELCNFYSNGYSRKHDIDFKAADEIIHLFEQPKVFEIEVEMYRPNEAYQISEHWSPKITNNSIKIIKRINKIKN